MMGKRKKYVNSSYNLRLKKNPNNLIRKLTEDLKRHFPKEHTQVVKRCMKRYWTLLIIREMQIKTTMRYHLTSVRMVIMKKTTNNKFGKDVKKRELSYSAGGNVNWCSHYGKQCNSSRNNIIIQEFHSFGYISKENENSNLKRYTHPNVHSNIIYSRQDTEAT